MGRRFFVFFFSLTLFMTASFALSPKVHHPLDALTPDEYWTIYRTLREAGHVREQTVFTSVLLHEPPKSEVLKWKAGDAVPRKADVVLLDGGKSYAAVVDIGLHKVEAYSELKDAQAPLTDDERHAVEGEIKKDPRIADALKKRGITDLKVVTCYVVPAGYVALPEQEGNKRIGWGGCIDREGSTGTWDREIGGIFFTVDINAKKIVRFSDYGAVPMPTPSSYYDADGGPVAAGRQPIVVSQPNGPSFTEKDGEWSWDKWKFRFRLDPRIGAVIQLASIEDAGKMRSVMYEGSLSELYVPYMDPEETWNSHVFIDAGEYFTYDGIGTLKPLLAGVDCPTYASFFSATFYTTAGDPLIRPQMACMFERTNGDPAWRHGDEPGVFGRPSRELVLRTVAVVGNYDYLLDWRFEQDGSIHVGVGATGVLEVKPVKEKDVTGSVSDDLMAKDEGGNPLEFGQLVAPNVDGVDHDHFFCYRLDLDVDGTENSFMADKLVRYQLPKDNPSPRRVIWAMQPSMVAREGESVQDMSLQHPAMWRFVNHTAHDPYGYPTGFEIMPGITAASLLPDTEWPQKRAGFSSHQLWVTPYDPAEFFASGTYLLGSKGTDGLPEWVKKNRSIENTDIVAWYTVGFHHVPRPEDWPQMPIMWHDFEIRPFHFFGKNPGMDLPMTP
ncbi:MAG: Copper amine oxidase protein [Acidobacteriaceae bacterium]|nr:Copper amine oxidase protein [Acidobacteriaceae bacterium]